MTRFAVVGRVEVQEHFDEMIAATEAALAVAIVDWGNLTLNRIQAYETRIGDASPTRRVSPGVHLRDSYRISSVFKGLAGAIKGDSLPGGLYLLIYTPDANAIWQELGTRGRRKAKLSSATLARRQTPSGKARTAGWGSNKGVKPLYFMRHAMRDSYAEGLALVEQALR